MGRIVRRRLVVYYSLMMKRHSGARVLVLLLLAIHTLSNGSPAQTSTQTTPMTVSATQGTNEIPTVVWIGAKPMKILFTDYNGDGTNFTLHTSPCGPVLWFVPKIGMEVADRFRKSGYVIKKFEHKTRMSKIDATVSNEVDVSELTLQHEGEAPIVLVKGELKTVSEPVVRFVDSPSGRTADVYRSEERFGWGESQYKIIEIKADCVVIMDERTSMRTTVCVGH